MTNSGPLHICDILHLIGTISCRIIQQFVGNTITICSPPLLITSWRTHPSSVGLAITLGYAAAPDTSAAVSYTHLVSYTRIMYDHNNCFDKVGQKDRGDWYLENTVRAQTAHRLLLCSNSRTRRLGKLIVSIYVVPMVTYVCMTIITVSTK